MERVMLIKRKTSAEAKITIRVLEQDKGVSFVFLSSPCTKWRLVFEDRHTLAHATSQIPSGTASAQAMPLRLNSYRV